MKTIENAQIRFDYRKNNHLYQVTFEDNHSSDDFDATLTLKKQSDGSQFILNIIPHGPITIQSLVMDMKRSFDEDETIFVNGYQSWTDSREFFLDEKMKTISRLAKPLMNTYQFDKYGDYGFKKTSRRPGDFHGYTYGYIRRGERFDFIGSLTEANGFTIINTSVKDQSITIEKECHGITIDRLYKAFDLFMIVGKEDHVFDAYFKAMGIEKPKAKPMTGWTSWYNYYQNISQDVILDNLDALHQANKNIEIFQVDDGYQTYVGDWLETDMKKFPLGMKHIAQCIHDKGYKAGLWLAPFVCETNSRTFREKKHWILKDSNGELVLAGSNWSRFYALDLYHPEVRAYIKKVFKTVLTNWGYDLVKLDFLYAVCLIPTKTKTRGQIMTEAMAFIRECVGDKLILGCGVPLGPSFGRVDYCRIGCDVGLDWDDKPYMRLLHRERISTLNAIGNAIGRRHLNNRAFLNDPDVFFLREDNIRLTQTQKETVAFVNRLFGSLIFTSDDIRTYSDKQHQLFDEAMSGDDSTIVSVTPYRNGLIEVRFRRNDQTFISQINLTGKVVSNLKPYETKTIHLMEVK